ncbi:hypothetical protein O181_013281 [Austropuccinia psidii MF-1]|uniref:Uncharacterized protein n=1 Tax=Austropuccinia psidii MF-1 TaxID=1389203 RepID=A0A9Q3BW48_9BASI|nr:hypothetical protein [Austropuccinia psidii MF-1]
MTNDAKTPGTKMLNGKTLSDELKEETESEIQEKLSSRQDIIEVLSQSYTALRRSLKVLQDNGFWKTDYSSLGQELHTPHPKSSDLPHISEYQEVIPEIYGRQNESRGTCLKIFKDLKDVYEKITILVGNRLISLAGLHSILIVGTKKATSRPSTRLLEFFERFAFLSLNGT